MIQLKNALLTQINVREYRRDNQKWTIQKNGQHWAHKTKKNTTQHVLHSTMRKQKHNTTCVAQHQEIKRMNHVR